MAVQFNDSLLETDITSLSVAYRNKQVSPTEMTQKMLERIASKDKELNTYITVTEEDALNQAGQAEEEIASGIIRGPLHGVPIALKDLIFTKNARTTMGSEIFKEYIPSYHATVVEKLRKAGAVILGKLNTHQFAYGTTGDRSFFGPVKNAHDLAKISGGSSSGSGSAVAASLCYAALGTDTGGSIRIPSSFNGIVGMKPTFGRVSKYGVFPLCWTMDTVGPMTKTVQDNAILLNVLSGNDENDPYSVKMDNADFTTFLNKDINGMTIAVPKSSFFLAVDEEINQCLRVALDTFQKLGVQVKSIEIPDMDKIIEAFRTILKCEAYTVHSERLQEYPDQWDEEVKVRLLTGAAINAREYITAQQVKQKAMMEFRKVFSQTDVLIVPTVPILPVNIDEREIIIGDSIVHISAVLNKFTGPFNLLGLPSLSMPCGTSTTGLPIGLQLVGNWFDEATIYKYASALEVNTTSFN
ncbi:amidase [Neobacillus mesonae]|uniref:Asp-tRNA(Asn)/Glu-tRNA(Gln) amidotransferase GatCAB subunit A n=1 Tax=Neobacillus mesonae TaxID=1193713 RepID=A0A3T0HZF9_9BACI|nr:amidase [Neobacillus mesonae]AZU62531.1 Asp-tRNA(Asn)/Glu-tRNA(Gln) amidotransferase GatCAB subunit A [Neobacillus mesonae]